MTRPTTKGTASPKKPKDSSKKLSPKAASPATDPRFLRAKAVEKAITPGKVQPKPPANTVKAKAVPVAFVDQPTPSTGTTTASAASPSIPGKLPLSLDPARVYTPSPRNGPTPFSAALPALQLAWDSTSLRALMKCARFYQYSILEGYRSSAIDLEFGIYFAASLAEGRKVRAMGGSRDEAQLASVTYAVKATWLPPDGSLAIEHFTDGTRETTPDNGRPWGGVYTTQWHCTADSEVAYRNKAGNRAKCPYAHKGAWFPGHGPVTCGECGSNTESMRMWVPHDTQKDRLGLIRAVSWYWEDQPENEENGLHTVLFPDGRPAVELSFRLPTGYKASTGEDFIISGHMDAVKGLGIRRLDDPGAESAELFVTDDKTTRKTLAASYFNGYSPDVQTDLYDLAASLLFPGYNIKGVAIDGTQLLAEGARFQTQPLYRTEAHREEFHTDLGYWFAVAEGYAKAGVWPMNRGACWICPMNTICAMKPSERDKWAAEKFEKRPWNPLESR